MTPRLLSTGLVALGSALLVFRSHALVVASVVTRNGPKFRCPFHATPWHQHSLRSSDLRRPELHRLRMGSASFLSRKTRAMLQSLRNWNRTKATTLLPTSLTPGLQRSRLGSNDDGVDQTAPVEIQRTASMANYLLSILRPEFPQSSAPNSRSAQDCAVLPLVSMPCGTTPGSRGSVDPCTVHLTLRPGSTDASRLPFGMHMTRDGGRIMIPGLNVDEGHGTYEYEPKSRDLITAVVQDVDKSMLQILWLAIRLRWKIAVSMLWAVVATVASLAAPLSFSFVIKAVLGAPSSSLSRSLGVMGMLYAVEPMATFMYVRGMSGVVVRAGERLKALAFRSLLSQEVAFFDLSGSAELSAAVTTDVSVAQSTVQGNLQRDRGVRAALEMLGGLAVLLKLSPRLCWIFGILIPVMAWGLAVRNIREVRGFGAEARETSRFQTAARNSSATSTDMGATSGQLEALNRAGINICILTVMFTGARLVRSGLLEAPLLLSYIGFCFSLNYAMQGVNLTLADAKRGQEALRRVFKVMAPAGKGGGRTGVDVISPRDFEGKVDFRKVHFTYPTRPDNLVFSGLDLTLPAGKVTALVGYSGGGKTTIAALLSRFYTPTQGNIEIDGFDVVDLDRRWLRQKMALVGQNPALFTGTIAQNIAYGLAAATPVSTATGVADAAFGGGVEAASPLLGDDAGVDLDLGGVPMEKVMEAADLANSREFIESFPDGFNTLVGEGGVQLSGGQRQRVAIARAILKDARILILDEATSALDARSEALVQEALNRLMKGRTVLVIAHRLSTVVNADKICVLSKGKVIEEGTHVELLARKGAYSNLMSTQVRSYSTIAE